ncbi:periplasmic protein TonB [Gammaproteobacteria bacterium]
MILNTPRKDMVHLPMVGAAILSHVLVFSVGILAIQLDPIAQPTPLIEVRFITGSEGGRARTEHSQLPQGIQSLGSSLPIAQSVDPPQPTVATPQIVDPPTLAVPLALPAAQAVPITQSRKLIIPKKEISKKVPSKTMSIRKANPIPQMIHPMPTQAPPRLTTTNKASDLPTYTRSEIGIDGGNKISTSTTARNMASSGGMDTGNTTGSESDSTVSEAKFHADYLNNPRPVYPLTSRRMGEEGTVILKVQVGENGSALQVMLKSSSGSPRLDQSALDTVVKWKFIPARRGDAAVISWVLVPMKFSLNQSRD